MQMGESSKATVLQYKAIHMDCKTDYPHRVPNIPACVPQPGNPETRASLCALSTGRGLEFTQDFCPVKESRQSRAATSRIPFCSPRAGTKSSYAFVACRYHVRPRAGDLDILRGVAAESPIPSPVREEFTDWDNGRWRKIHR